MACENFKYIKYCIVNNILITGDNSTNKKKAIIKDFSEYSDILIPLKVGNNEVKDIGQYSFHGLYNLEKVVIEARITQINPFSFADCKKLKQINIPNTLEFIFEYGLQTYDWTISSTNSGPPNPYENFNVIFEKIKIIATHAISYRAKVDLYFCEEVNPITVYDTFKKNTYTIIHSPVQFQIGSYTTNFISHEKSNLNNFFSEQI
jgi:hypothetical protein